MKCNECQTEIPDGSKFCNQCGAKFDVDGAPTPSTTTAVKQDVEAEPIIAKNSRGKNTIRNIVIACLLLAMGVGGYLYYARDSLFITGDPDQLMTAYYQNIKDANYENAYEMLSQVNKNTYSKEEFVLLEQLRYDDLMQLKDFKVMRVTDYKNKNIDGKKFLKVLEYDITQTLLINGDNNKEQTVTNKGCVVSEDGILKIYREKEDIKSSISTAYVSLGYMYLSGEGIKKDLYTAAEYNRKALSYKGDNAEAYFQLGYVYNQLKNWDDSIKMYEQALANAGEDNEFRSTTYTNMGVSYFFKLDRGAATECYKKAVELDPNNERAKAAVIQSQSW